MNSFSSNHCGSGGVLNFGFYIPFKKNNRKRKRPKGAKKCKSLTKWKNLTHRKNCYNHIFQHMRPLDTYISSQRVKITRKNIKHEILEKVTELE